MNPRFDTVVKNGMIIDGSWHPHIALTLESRWQDCRNCCWDAGEGKREIDASGLIVAPGFIDLHTHYDAQVFLGSSPPSMA